MEPNRCGAKKRDGTSCQRWAMSNGRCRLHGGKSLRGVDAPSFKTGKYSKYMPPEFARRVWKLSQDPDIIVLREDIALLEARLSQLLERIEGTNLKQAWEEAGQHYQNFSTATWRLSALREAGASKALMDQWEVRRAESYRLLGEVLEKGVGDAKLWKQISNLLERKRRLVESERRRLVDLKQMMTAEQILTMFASLAQAVKKHVRESGTLEAIRDDFARATGQVSLGMALRGDIEQSRDSEE